MLLLVMLLAQVVPSSDEEPVTAVPSGNVLGIHKLWEELNSACRKLPYDSPDGWFVCHRRDVVSVELSRLGWCFTYMGLEIKWEMCPRR